MENKESENIILMDELKEEISKSDQTLPMELYDQNNIDILKNAELVKPEDIEFIQDHSKKFQERFIKRSAFRSDFEMRYSVLNSYDHPTPDSKYWQAIGEQSAQVEEIIRLSYGMKKIFADIEYIQAEIYEFECQLGQKRDYDYDFEIKKIEANIKKKKIELQEKRFGLTIFRKEAKERMREIRHWEKIIDELEPQCKYAIDNWELHHSERYIKRYGQRMQNLNIVGEGERESIIRSFIGFADAPENKELAEEFVKKLNNKPHIPLENSDILTGTASSQINYSSKDELMEKDPLTKNFLTKRVYKILIGAPHKIKGTPNVTNFFLTQPPAGFEMDIEEPYGFSVPDARNLIVNIAIKKGYDYIFFVDDDIIIPRMAIVKLIHHKADIVGGFYYRKYYPLESVGMNMIKDGEDEIPSPIENFKIGDIIHNTLILPSGITLIKTDVFKRMEPPWYRTYTINNQMVITEDAYICQKMRDLNIDIMTDTGVQGIHIDRENGIIYGHPEIVDPKINKIYHKWANYFAFESPRK